MGELKYIRNMSSVGKPLPCVEQKKRAIEYKYGATINMVEQTVEQWDWGTLARACGFSTCEVLVIDAEGSDTRILRSLMRHCQRDPNLWPRVIQFETMGHCDTKEGRGTEWKTIYAMVEAQYMLITYGDHNTIMVHRNAYQRHRRISTWVARIECSVCHQCGQTPFAAEEGGYRCGLCVAWMYWKSGRADWKRRTERWVCEESEVTWPRRQAMNEWPAQSRTGHERGSSVAAWWTMPTWKQRSSGSREEVEPEWTASS